MPRIPDPDRSSLPADAQRVLAALPDLALFRMLANAPAVLAPWLGLGAALLAAVELPARQRELAVLTVAHTAQCRYEWVQHEAIAAASGVSPDEIAAIASGTVAGLLGPADAAVVRLAAEAVPGVEVSASAIAAARAELGDRQTVELLCLTGYYLATAIVARSTGIGIDPPAGLAVIDVSGELVTP